MPAAHNSKEHIAVQVHHAFISEKNALYLTHTLRFFAVSLIGIFLPMYIFGLSGNLQIFSTNAVRNGLIWVLVYNLFQAVTVLYSLLFLTDFIFKKEHFRHSIVLSFFILAVEIVLWILSADNLYLIIPAGILNGLNIFFYWVPYHIFFIRKAGKSGHYSKEIGFRHFLSTIASSAGPLIGGLTITTFGFNALFAFCFIIILLAGLPVFFYVAETPHVKHNVFEIVKSFRNKYKTKYLNLAYFGMMLETLIYTTFWPVLIFIILKDFAEIGSLNSAAKLLAAITTLWVGIKFSKKGLRNVQKFGSTVNALLYIPRMLFNIPVIFYSIELIDHFNSSFYALPIETATYEKAHSYGESDFMLYREFFLYLSKFLLCLVLIGLLLFIDSWRWILLLGSVGALLSYFIQYELKANSLIDRVLNR